MRQKLSLQQSYRYSYLLRVTGKAFKYFGIVCFSLVIVILLSAIFNWPAISQWILFFIAPKLLKTATFLLLFTGTVFFIESIQD